MPGNLDWQSALGFVGAGGFGVALVNNVYRRLNRREDALWTQAWAQIQANQQEIASQRQELTNVRKELADARRDISDLQHENSTIVIERDRALGNEKALLVEVAELRDLGLRSKIRLAEVEAENADLKRQLREADGKYAG